MLTYFAIGLLFSVLDVLVRIVLTKNGMQQPKAGPVAWALFLILNLFCWPLKAVFWIWALVWFGFEALSIVRTAKKLRVVE